MPRQTGRLPVVIVSLLSLFQLQWVYGEAWRDNPEWFGREKTLRSGLRAGEAVQHLEYKSFFTRHVIVECFEGFDGFSIGLGWSEISIDRDRPVLYSIDGRESGLLPKPIYNDEHFVQLPVDHESSIAAVAGFIRGLTVAFWTRDRINIEYEHPYSLSGFTQALEEGCGWHPAVAEAKQVAKEISY